MYRVFQLINRDKLKVFGPGYHAIRSAVCSDHLGYLRIEDVVLLRRPHLIRLSRRPPCYWVQTADVHQYQNPGSD